MLRFLTDQNFNGDILRGMLLRQPGLDVVRIQDEPVIDGADDPDILEWADRNNRIVLTHDENSFPDFAYARMGTGRRMAGVFVVKQETPIGRAITE